MVLIIFRASDENDFQEKIWISNILKRTEANAFFGKEYLSTLT